MCVEGGRVGRDGGGGEGRPTPEKMVQYREREKLHILLSPHVIVEPSLNRWPVAQVTAVVAFHGLSQDVSTGVPEHILTCTHTQVVTAVNAHSTM